MHSKTADLRAYFNQCPPVMSSMGANYATLIWDRDVELLLIAGWVSLVCIMQPQGTGCDVAGDCLQTLIVV